MYGSSYKFAVTPLELCSREEITEEALKFYPTLEEVWKDEVRRRTIFQMKSYVLQTDTDVAKVEVPTSWWQAFKYHNQKKWWMRWFVKKKPVKMETLKFPVIFPFANMKLPEGMGRMVLLAENKDPFFDHVSFGEKTIN